MMRSIAESMKSSFAVTDCNEKLLLFGQRRFELRDRLVGETKTVVFAVVKHLHDDLEQAVVGRESVGNGAALAQIVRRDGVGIAYRLHVHNSQPALDQHVQALRDTNG